MAGKPGLNVDWHPAELPAGTGVHLQTSVTVDGNAAKGTLDRRGVRRYETQRWTARPLGC